MNVFSCVNVMSFEFGSRSFSFDLDQSMRFLRYSLYKEMTVYIAYILSMLFFQLLVECKAQKRVNLVSIWAPTCFFIPYSRLSQIPHISRGQFLVMFLCFRGFQ